MDEFLIKKRDFVLNAIAFSTATQLLSNLTGRNRGSIEAEIVNISLSKISELDENDIDKVVNAYFMGQQNHHKMTIIEMKFTA